MQVWPCSFLPFFSLAFWPLEKVSWDKTGIGDKAGFSKLSPKAKLPRSENAVGLLQMWDLRMQMQPAFP